jgi:hypothetical protein
MEDLDHINISEIIRELERMDDYEYSEADLDE